MTQQPDRICILGGGFGGLYTALNLSQLSWPPDQKPEITLVDRHDRFLFSPFLYELLTGELQTWEIAPPFLEVLEGTGVRFCQGTVTGIDLESRQVHLEAGGDLAYDRLVLALGNQAVLDLVPGALDHALPFKTLDHAYHLEERLRRLEESEIDKIRVAIVGAGYSGVELACKLADRLGDRGRLRLVEQANQILQTATEFNRKAANKALEDRGVWVDLETTVESIGPQEMALAYKGKVDALPVELVLWTVGNRVNPLVKDLGLKQNQRGQVVVSSALQVMDHPELFALGDLAECRDAEGQQVPPTAQVAFQQASYVSWNVWASLSDRPLLPFRYEALGEMMTLGIETATLTGLGLKLEGPLAHVARRLAYLYRMPTLAHQIKVGLNWIAQPFVKGLV
ncbi:MAG: NAD(P)/FAD-dependent oxidoreductase [Leptolyngbyaceae cyanobacterium bins.59]|nr:NAD(P)/FAD-dependent oxidoreductase [Leptolyngbyaceae cyanobacterium bins.59]